MWRNFYLINAMHRGDVKVFVGMGGNFALAAPDTAYTFDALRRCELTVQVSTKLNRSHLVHGKQALILPCLARSSPITAMIRTGTSTEPAPSASAPGSASSAPRPGS